MANATKFYVLAAFLMCMAAYGGYIYGGHQRQKELDRQFELLNYKVWATDVNTRVALPTLIKEKRYQEAENKLEGLLDVTLASLSLYERLAKDHPDDEIFDALHEARSYREKYAGHVVHQKLTDGVERALKMGR